MNPIDWLAQKARSLMPAGLVLVAFLPLASVATAGVMVLVDRDFAPNDWETFEDGPGGLAMGATLTGGNPATGTRRRVSYPPFQVLRVTELSDALDFDPSSTGAVASIGAALQVKVIAAVAAAETAVGLAVEQNGVTHYATLGVVPANVAWATVESLDIVPLLPGVDWSLTGGPLRFGFFVAAEGQQHGSSSDVDIDNIEITIDAPVRLHLDDLVLANFSGSSRRISRIDPADGRETVIAGCAPWASGVGGAALNAVPNSPQCDLEIGAGLDLPSCMGTDLSNPRKIALEAGGFVLNRNWASNCGVSRIDVVTGDRSVVTSPDVNPPGSDPWTPFQDVTTSPADTLYGLTQPPRVVEIDGVTGERATLTLSGTCGTTIWSWTFAERLTAGRIAAYQGNLKLLAVIDPAAGSCDSVFGSPPAWLFEANGMATTVDGDILLSLRTPGPPQVDQLRRIDPETGATTVLASNDGIVGSGADFRRAEGVAVLSDDRIAIAKSIGAAAIVLIDPVSLVRVEIPGLELLSSSLGQMKAVGIHDRTPSCSDGVDNDGDGAIDYDGGAARNGGVPIASPDPSCGSAVADSEVAPVPGLTSAPAALLNVLLVVVGAVALRFAPGQGLRVLRARSDRAK